MVAALVEANLLLILTDVPGFFTANPKNNSQASLLLLVKEIDSKLESLAKKNRDSFTVGGMKTKIEAAKKATNVGIPVIIASAKEEVIAPILHGEEIGTLFLPLKGRRPNRKQWISITLAPKGCLVVDEGACQAILAQGKSLLPSGILEVRGEFNVGNAVKIIDRKKREFARGLVNYDPREIEKIKRAKTSQIAKILGYKTYDEVIHRDNLVITQANNGQLQKH